MGSGDVFLSLGSNLGDRCALLEEAESALGQAGF
jgi:7,8-dihydro-6-hydroxymethylpterin-pyrophosphokinase